MSDRKSVLLLDRDPSMRRELQALLREGGYDVEPVSRVSDAVKKAKELPIGCIIMDASWASVDGCEAVEIMKSIMPAVPIIVTTSENTKDLEAEIRKKNVFYYYIKSFDRGELHLAVKSAFKHWKEAS